MRWGGIARFEWLLFDGLVFGFLAWQLVSVRRLIRADREKAARDVNSGRQKNE